MQQDNQSDIFDDLTLDVTAKQHLSSMAGWAMIVVIVAMAGYVLSIADMLTGPPAGAGSESLGFGLSLSGTETISSVIIILLGLLINFFLYRFASQARSGLKHLDQEQLNSSFNSLKTHFVITAVVTAILFLFVLLVAVGLGTNTIGS